MASDTNSDKTSGYKLFKKWEWRGFGFRSDEITFGYMRRWVFKTPWFLLRLHHIMKSDNDRHFHDHPFDFVSFILRGGYVEFTPRDGQWDKFKGKTYMPGSVLFRRADQLHYLKLRGSSAWTFLITSPYYRDWGFMTEDGWIKADRYDEWLAKKQNGVNDAAQ